MTYDTIQERQTGLESFLDTYLSSKPKQEPLNGKNYKGDGTGLDVQTVLARVNRSKIPVKQ